MKPAEGDFVVYCRGSQIQVIDSTEWDAKRATAQPVLSLSGGECLVLERFLRYWLGDQGDSPVYRLAGVDVEFDF